MPNDEHEVVEALTPPRESPGNNALVLAACLIAALCSGVFAVALLTGRSLTLYGSALATALLFLALAVRRYFAASYPVAELSEPRGPDSDDGGAEGEPPLVKVKPVRRRRLLQGLLVGGAGVVGASMVAPISTLGPRPRHIPGGTVWRAGMRLITPDGQPISADAVPPGGFGVVWPEGEVRNELASVILLRLPPAEIEPPTNLDWVVNDELVAYSKVCTHIGCPVGLFQARTGSLFCPCHQQSFDAGQGARPVFGPASRPLPQLPLGLDDEGFLVALGDFVDPVGPPVGVRRQ